MTLPAWHTMDAVIRATCKDGEDSCGFALVCGSTGCGKSTQVPQFILDHMDETQRGAACRIICTQPRRISAISLASRVASERCEQVGETVGYQIHLNSALSRDTRLLFCTTGVLLRKLTSDPTLRDVSHLIIDEVHERDLDSDFLLAFIHHCRATLTKTKIILMSATVQLSKFAQYFQVPPVNVIDL